MEVEDSYTEQELVPIIQLFLPVAKYKANSLFGYWSKQATSPVFTKAGKYHSWGWTEWTRGFLYGIPLLLYEMTGEQSLLESVRKNIHRLDSYLTHTGVHDHGFNILSTLSICTYPTHVRSIKNTSTISIWQNTSDDRRAFHSTMA